MCSRLLFAGFFLPLALTAAICVGCGRGGDAQPKPKPPASKTSGEQQGAQPGKTDHSKQPPPKPSMPQVVLTEAEQQTCLVKVGDLFPRAKLPDLHGKMHSLGELFGPRLSVVCFWTGGNTEQQQSRAVDVLEFLQSEVSKPFSQQARVIGVNVGDDAQTIAELTNKAGVQFVTLVDAQGALLKQVATDERLPRVYLLDAQGKVLWFDMELRRISRQDLLAAIAASLGQAQ